MEVTVLDALNAPLRPVLTIHTGSVRRQAKLEVNQPFIIPSPNVPNSTVEVALFQQLASQLLPDDGKAEAVADIPVRKPDGTASQVKLGVKRGNAMPAAPKPSSQDPLSATRDYLDQHQLQQKIQNLIQDVLHNQPDDPYRYMLQQLKRNKARPLGQLDGKQEDSALAGATESLGLVPRPPDQPKPTGGSPRKGRSSGSKADQGVLPRGASEAQEAARWALRRVFQLPELLCEAEKSCRQHLQMCQSLTIASAVLTVARDKAAGVGQAVSTPASRSQETRASVGKLYENAAFYNSQQFRTGLTRWTLKLCYRSAANRIGSSDEIREACFEADSRRRVSLPQPYVYLEAGGSNWSAWLCGSSSSPERRSSKSKGSALA
jgi:hypothetical protein